MPKNLRADIDYHKARIAFYTQALGELEADRSLSGVAARRLRMEGLKIIIADLERTKAALQSALADLEAKRSWR